MLETPRFGLRSLLSLRHDEDGAAMAEYGLLITLIAAVVAGVASALGTDILASYTAVAGYFAGLPTTP